MGPPYKDQTLEESLQYRNAIGSDLHLQRQQPGKKDGHSEAYHQSCDCGWIPDSPRRQPLVWHILCETCLIVREATADLLRALAGMIDP